jgi:hypothetical protein
MAKTRMLKHHIRSSQKVASWPIEVRYFWVLLWGYVDDHGKAIDNALLVKADTFPLDREVTEEVIDGWLWLLVDAQVINRYTVGGTDYLEVINWREHQKPPHPTADVLPSSSVPESIAREPHAELMHDAGNVHAELTPSLGWVKSGFGSGFGFDAHVAVAEKPVIVFDDFWRVWPRKEKRKDAETAWASAIKRVSPQTIVDVAAEYSAHPHRVARQFVPYGATWLRGDCWNDPMPLAPERDKTTAQQTTKADQNAAEFQRIYGGDHERIGSIQALDSRVSA